MPTIALNCGAVLRDAARDPRTAARLLADDAALAALLAAVDAPSFETASDAFATLRDLLTRHKDVVAAHLEAGDGALFGALAPLLASPNYVTRRQSVRLLGELLLERANAGAMLRYVGDPDNLKAGKEAREGDRQGKRRGAAHRPHTPTNPPPFLSPLSSHGPSQGPFALHPVRGVPRV